MTWRVRGLESFLQAAPMPTPRQQQMNSGIAIGRIVHTMIAAITPPIIPDTRRECSSKLVIQTYCSTLI